MAQTVTLSATAREKTGKGAARQARFQKQIPAVIYGHGRDSQPLMVDSWWAYTPRPQRAFRVRDWAGDRIDIAGSEPQVR